MEADLSETAAGAARAAPGTVVPRSAAAAPGGRDPIFEGTLAMAVRLAGGQAAGGGSSRP